ncbi:UNVERIFIED_CONTAM: CRISPR-associated Cas2 family protein [Acetivibrio alkalicellulosi]
MLECDSTEDINSSKRLVLIIYDIVNDKRRRAMVKCLESFGIRVQKSAFECCLDETLYKKMLKKLEKIISEEDLLRVYRLSSRCNIECWGSVQLFVNSDYWVL